MNLHSGSGVLSSCLLHLWLRSVPLVQRGTDVVSVTSCAFVYNCFVLLQVFRYVLINSRIWYVLSFTAFLALGFWSKHLAQKFFQSLNFRILLLWVDFRWNYLSTRIKFMKKTSDGWRDKSVVVTCKYLKIFSQVGKYKWQPVGCIWQLRRRYVWKFRL